MDDTQETYTILLTQIDMITKAMHDDDPITVLEETDILLQTLEPTYILQHSLKKLMNNIKTLLNTPSNNRLLRLNSKIKQELETAIEFYDEDIGTDERLFYNEELERTILQTYSEIRRLLAILIKTRFSDEINI